jgi:peptidoglycan biosynthesis protein MviN/MurJ (putative lipid II flippase)
MIGAIFFGIMYSIISRWFYAHKDTKTPLTVSVFTIGLNIILAYTLSRPSMYGVAGLALAQSIVAATEVAILTCIMIHRDRKLFDWDFISGLIRIASVTGFTVVAGFIMISIYPLEIADKGFFVLGTKVALITLVTFAVHVGMSSLFNLDEVRPALNRLKRLITKPVNWQG